MGAISTGIGLISGIDTATLIDSLITLESRSKFAIERRISDLSAQRTALLDINTRLLNFKNASRAFRFDDVFRSTLANTSNEEVLTATAGTSAQLGTYQFRVKQLVSNSSLMTRGFTDRDSSGIGLQTLSFEFGQGTLSQDRRLEDLNGGAGVARGEVLITDKSGNSATIDLTDVTALSEVIDRINTESAISVTAAADGDHLVINDTSGGGGSLTVANVGSDTTATELGIEGTTAGTAITGTSLFTIAGTTSLSTLNDGRGVLTRNGSADLRIEARNGDVFEVDLGRVQADIDATTLLADLNNGTGIAINSDADDPDIKFVDRDGTEYEVDLTGVTTVGGLITRVDNATSGRIAISVTDGEKLTVTDTVGGPGNLRVLGAGENGNEAAEDLGILNEAGIAADTFDGSVVPSTVTDPAVQTVQDVVDRINNALDTSEADNAGRIVASIASDGVSLLITDTTGGGGNLSINSTAANPHAAEQLGIYTGSAGVAADTVDGSRLIAGLDDVLVKSLNGGAGLNVPAGTPATLAGSTLLADLFEGSGITTNGNAASPDIQVQDRDGNTYDIELDGLTTVQDLIDAFDSTTGGNVTLAINGQTLEATNNSGGVGNFSIADINGATAATEFGIVDSLSVLDGETIAGTDTEPLAPPADATTINVTDRNGNSFTLANLDTLETLDEIIAALNAEAASNGVDVTFSLNANETGLLATDSSGGSGNLTISGDAADPLGLAADVAGTEVIGRNLQRRYVDEATRLSDLNFGRGIGTGSFRITDGFGETATVSVGSDAETLYDVITEINSRGLAVNARVNDNGDGIIIEADIDSGSPFVKMKIEDVSGSAAADLRIAGEADSVDDAVIEGSYEVQIDVAETDTLNKIRDKINASGAPVSATIINAGSGSTPFRLSFTSGIAGASGDLIVDSGDFDLGTTTLSEGRDAKVFFGSADPRQAFIITNSSNTLEGIVDGVTIDLQQASDELVTLTVDRDKEGIVDAVRSFATTFNDAIGRINDFDFFDNETEERGILLGNRTTARVRDALYRTLRTPAIGVDGPFRRLEQVGLTVNSKGEITFDAAKFEELYASNPDAMEDLFAAFESESSSTTEVAPGVTIQEASTTNSKQGIGDIFDQLLDQLTNSINGTMTLADEAIGSQIELNQQRIEDIDIRLESRRAFFQRQFADLELTLARLQEQSATLGSLQTNIAGLSLQR